MTTHEDPFVVRFNKLREETLEEHRARTDKIASKFSDGLSVTRATCDDATALMELVPREPADHRRMICQFLLARSIKGCRAIAALEAIGCEQDACAVLRVLLEHVVDGAYILSDKTGDLGERFRRYASVDKHKNYLRIREKAKESIKKTPDEELAEKELKRLYDEYERTGVEPQIDEQTERMIEVFQGYQDKLDRFPVYNPDQAILAQHMANAFKEKYGYKGKPDEFPGHWRPQKLHKTAALVDMNDEYRLVYQMFCSAVHPSYLGHKLHNDFSSDDWVADAAPRATVANSLLAGACRLMLSLLKRFVQEYTGAQSRELVEVESLTEKVLETFAGRFEPITESGVKPRLDRRMELWAKQKSIS